MPMGKCDLNWRSQKCLVVVNVHVHVSKFDEIYSGCAGRILQTSRLLDDAQDGRIL